MADTLEKSELQFDDNAPDLVFYEGSCIFDPDKKIKLAAFYVYRCTKRDFDTFLELGYRKFAYRFFRYVCDCSLCSSIRIIVPEFTESRSHKRILKRNAGLEFRVRPLEYHDDHYNLYCTHHATRGFKVIDRDMFVQEFYLSPVDAFITEILDGNRIVGLGFVDEGVSCLSSVYFIYDPAYSASSLGIFSAIREIELARSMKKEYYYLGLYCKDRKFLGYKDRFRPHEILDYSTGTWKRI